MKRILLASLMVLGSFVFGSTVHARCSDPRVAEVRARISDTCHCTGNHGRYVSCVAHAVRDAVRNEEIDTNCKGAVTRCAARSTCGKKTGFVTCALCSPGTCSSGFCDDGVTACTVDAECAPVLNHCSTKSTPELCEARGGVVGSGSCCDATCIASPAGAFIE